MSGIRLLNAHYVWEDFLSMGMGAVIVLTSWMVGDVGSQSVATNAAIVGILVLWLGAVEILGFAPLGGGLRNRVWVVAHRVAIRF